MHARKTLTVNSYCEVAYEPTSGTLQLCMLDFLAPVTRGMALTSAEQPVQLGSESVGSGVDSACFVTGS